MDAFGGLLPIVATPFSPDGTLDETSLRRLVEFLTVSGADGLGALGLASEAFTLDTSERQRVVRIVRETAPGLPLIVGAGGGSVAPACEQARAAADWGADAVMVMAPYPVTAPSSGLADFFGAVADAGNVPVVVQDAPNLTGVRVTAQVLEEAATHPLVRHVKVEAQPTAQKVTELVDHLDDTVTVLGGQNALFCWEELDRGAAGTMPACEFTDELRRVLDERGSGDRDAAGRRFHRLLPLLRYGLQTGIAWAVHKHVLVRRGVIATPTVRWPARPLDARTERELDGLLDSLELPDPG